MNTSTEAELAKLAEAGLKKCLLKITGVTPGEWELQRVLVLNRSVRETLKQGPNAAAAAGVIRVKTKGEPPFLTALLFDPEDSRHIASCFVDDKLYGILNAEQTDDTIIEIGNIVLNALVNSVLRVLRKTAIPSVPAYFKGDAGAIENWLGAGSGTFTVISADFTLEREGRSASARAIAFLPPAMFPAP